MFWGNAIPIKKVCEKQVSIQCGREKERIWNTVIIVVSPICFYGKETEKSSLVLAFFTPTIAKLLLHYSKEGCKIFNISRKWKVFLFLFIQTSEPPSPRMHASRRVKMLFFSITFELHLISSTIHFDDFFLKFQPRNLYFCFVIATY